MIDVKTVENVFIHGELVLDSPMHIGAADGDDYMGVIKTFRNGAGDVAIPGPSMAGVFVEWALHILDKTTDEELLRRLTGKRRGKVQHQVEFLSSAFAFSTMTILHKDRLPSKPHTHIRDMVRLSPKTRTPVHGAKFALETVDPGLRFEFLLQCRLVDIPEDLRQGAVDLLKAVVNNSWTGPEKCAFIGAGSSRGLGWFHLENTKVCLVNSKRALDSYLDAESDIEWAREQKGVDWNELFICEAKRIPKTWAIALSPRIEEGNYGCSPILVRDAREEREEHEADVDLAFTVAHYWSFDTESGWDSVKWPVIPGSSWRGSSRAFLSSLVASGEKMMFDEKEFTRRFGDVSQVATLKYCDARFIPPEDGEYRMKVERVALDEFTRAVYGSGKFNNEPIFAGHFEGKIAIIESMPDHLVPELNALLAWGGLDSPWVGIGAGASPAVWELVNP